MEPNNVSKKLLKRLPVYLNYLKSLPEHSENISATAIAKALGLGDVQVRKDLAKVSHEGRRRTGRSREQLIRDIEEYLDMASTTGIIIVGAGKLGQALLDYSGFEKSGMSVLAAFDIEPPAKQSAAGKPIYPMNRLESFCKCYDIRIAIIAVPGGSAQKVCDTLVSCGIRAIWNFAPVHLDAPSHILIQNQNMATNLAVLSMHLRAQMMPKKEKE